MSAFPIGKNLRIKLHRELLVCNLSLDQKKKDKCSSSNYDYLAFKQAANVVLYSCHVLRNKVRTSDLKLVLIYRIIPR